MCVPSAAKVVTIFFVLLNSVYLLVILLSPRDGMKLLCNIFKVFSDVLTG